MKYDIYLFDWDNTLADTLSIWLQGYQRLAIEFDEKLSRKQAYDQLYSTNKFIKKHSVTKADKNKLMQETFPLLNHAELHPQAIEIIQKLKRQGKKIGLISSSGSTVNKGIKFHNIEDLFDCVITANDVEKVKPDPEAINLALQKLGFNKNSQSAVYIGDALTDVEAAHAADIDAISFYWTKVVDDLYPIDRFDKVDPEYLITDLEEILNI